MSVEHNVMQFVLNILRNGIVESGSTQQMGFTPHDQITASKLPFVQVYSPVIEAAEAVVQQPGSMTVQVDILDVKGRNDEVRHQLQALEDTLNIDQTFQGLIAKGTVSARAVSERAAQERTYGGVTILVQFKSGAIDVVGEALPNSPTTQLLDMGAANWSATAVQIEDSKRIRGGLGIRRDAASGSNIVLDASSATGQPGFPMDLSNAVTLRLRSLLYSDPEYSNAIFAPTLTLFRDVAGLNGGLFSPAEDAFVGFHGWRYSAIDHLATPDFVFGTGLGSRSVIEIVRFTWSMLFSTAFSSTQFGMILMGLGYHLRDTGVNAGSGYHSDL